MSKADPSKPNQAGTQDSKHIVNSQWSHSDVLGRLIVRFQSYKAAEDHKADLAAALAQAGGAWKWIDRHNAASLYPTDFALLEVADAVLDSIKVSHLPARLLYFPVLCSLFMCARLQSLLSSWPGVKDVHPEQQVRRSLTWDTDSTIQAKAQDQAASDTEWVQKRPGRYAATALTNPSYSCQHSCSGQT